ncbi:MAG: ABC transporter, substrate-binding protein (cluster 8, B12/iron complex) [uncultured Pyrinomonadaceae bacterium]|uniref:ABC transporter, substrate-binding protein (Cluster 8, B12/iron complex) n=1 Tax=uncultured Pyrinomonadaceae bacterium TaxID=2283094 RepID=A0A6J4NDU7_9BACT|nr:MAG: ABC transporter, substrate-binding protein (cluster 8, B12/iron complex) [uncultured Pyrinomonadaceae bacterium]
MQKKSQLKIVSLLPSATEIVCALGLEENLIGITHECDYPESITGKPPLTASRISHETMSSQEIDHAVRSNLDGHGSIYDLDEQLLAKLKPDLIITQELCEVCAVSYQTVQKAARMYVADAKVVSLEPNTIADIFENIKTVGNLCGVSERAETVVADLQNRLDLIGERIRENKTNSKTQIQNPKTFMLEWLEPPFAPGHWVPEQVEIAGGIALLGEAGKKSLTTTYEAIYESQPEVIVLIPCGYYIKDIVRQLEKSRFPPDWRELPAVKNGNVWAMNASAYFSRPAPRVVDGAEILAKIFHSDIFGEPNKTEAIRVQLNFADSD